MESMSCSSGVEALLVWAKGLEERFFEEEREREEKAEDRVDLEEGSAEEEGAEPN